MLLRSLPRGSKQRLAPLRVWGVSSVLRLTTSNRNFQKSKKLQSKTFVRDWGNTIWPHIQNSMETIHPLLLVFFVQVCSYTTILLRNAYEFDGKSSDKMASNDRIFSQPPPIFVFASVLVRRYSRERPFKCNSVRPGLECAAGIFGMLMST